VTCIVDEDEGLMSTSVPIVKYGITQVSDGLLEGLEVCVFDLKNIHAACPQSQYSLLNVPGVIFNLFDVCELSISFHTIAQLVVVPVRDNDPLVVIGSEMSVYHLGVFLYFCSAFFF